MDRLKTARIIIAMSEKVRDIMLSNIGRFPADWNEIEIEKAFADVARANYPHPEDVVRTNSYWEPLDRLKLTRSAKGGAYIDERGGSCGSAGHLRIAFRGEKERDSDGRPTGRDVAYSIREEDGDEPFIE
jgi:hypothetical protein